MSAALEPTPAPPAAAAAIREDLRYLVELQRAHIADLEMRLAQSETHLGHVQHSTAWLATRPLRRFLSTRPYARRLLRRLGLVLSGDAAGASAAGAAAGAAPAAAVPFVYLANGATVPAPAPTVAVICHSYYTDVAPEIRDLLAHLPLAYDLYVSTDSVAKQRELEACFGAAGLTAGRVEVKVVPNRGRDIAPKLLAWDQAYASHEYVLHLHTKKSAYAGGGLDHWRAYLLYSLLGSPGVVASVFEAFRRDPGLGMIAPDHLPSVRPGVGWTRNFAQAQELARRFGVHIEAGGPLDFPSGSMFWARSAALRPLLDCKLQFEDFDAESGQLDGTLAHAIERLYFFSCEKAGLAWLKIVPAALASMQAGRSRVIDSPAALARFCSRDRVWLTRSAPPGAP
jgi:lipopolysaccharide biosynthesis protein